MHVCQLEMTITKSNTELNAHSASKHGKTIEECFPGAKEAQAELLAAVASGKGGKAGDPVGATKVEKKKNDSAGLDDLLSAGLSAGAKKGKK
jgi:predicted RNase H-like HicB family nuclease